MSHLTPVPATLEHAAYMAAHLRPEDRRELASSNPGTPLETVLANAVRASLPGHRWAALDSETGNPVLLFGCVEMMPHEVGCPWMIATPDIPKHTRQVATSTRPWLDAFPYRTLTNRADLRNVLHIRWLRFGGFRFGGTIKAPDGSLFITFSRTRTDV